LINTYFIAKKGFQKKRKVMERRTRFGNN